MAYEIHTKLFKPDTFSTYDEAKLLEVFYVGMRVDYSLKSPDGGIKEVKFKKSVMATIEQLDKKIEDVQKQIFQLEINNLIPLEEKEDLMTYYQNRLRSYLQRKSSQEKVKVS
jgi:hypothetical protein